MPFEAQGVTPGTTPNSNGPVAPTPTPTSTSTPAAPASTPTPAPSSVVSAGTSAPAPVPAPGTATPGAGIPSSQPPAGAQAGSPPGTPPAAAGSGAGQAPQSFLEQLRTAGVPIQPNMSEADAVKALVQLHQQQSLLQQHGPALREYLQNQQAYQQWQAAQRGQPAAPAAAPKKDEPWWKPFWAPPEFDQALARHLRYDEQGQLVADKGYEHLLPQYANYEAYRRQQTEKLLQNPFAFIEEPVKLLAKQMAEQVVKQNLGGYQDELFVQDVTRQHSEWLYAKDPAGNPIKDPVSGGQMLTEWGQRYRQYVMQAAAPPHEGGLGITDIRAQHSYAFGLVQRDAAAHQVQHLSAGQQNDQLKNQFLQNGNAPNVQGSLAPGTPPSTGVPQNTGLTLMDRLRKNLTGVDTTK